MRNKSGICDRIGEMWLCKRKKETINKTEAAGELCEKLTDTSHNRDLGTCQPFHAAAGGTHNGEEGGVGTGLDRCVELYGETLRWTSLHVSRALGLLGRRNLIDVDRCCVV